MKRCFIVAATFVLLSNVLAVADGDGTDKPKVWPYGPYDKLHREQSVIVSNESTIIIQNSTTNIMQNSTTNRTEFLIYRGTEESVVDLTATNKIVVPKLELHPK